MARLLQMCDGPDFGHEDDISCAEHDLSNSDEEFLNWSVEDNDCDDVDNLSAHDDVGMDASEGDVSDAISDEIDFHLFRKYKTEQTVITLFGGGKPISATHLQDDSFAIQLKHDKLLPINRYEHEIQACGLSYFRWELGAAVAVDPVNRIVKYCLMLPRLSADGRPYTSAPGSMSYAVITSEWEELNSEGQFSYPNNLSISL